MGSPDDGSARKSHSGKSMPMAESSISPPADKQQKERHVLSSVLSETQEAQGDQIDALLEKLRFLEDQVRRLNAELAEYQAGRGQSSGPSPDPPESSGQSVNSNKAGSPLMVAYDRRLEEQSRLIGERTAQAEELSGQVEALVSENEHLLRELQRSMRVIESRGDEAEASQSAAEATARSELLLRENDLLVEQQKELEAELSGAQKELTTTTAENNRLQRERAHLLDRAESATAELERWEKERNGRQLELRQLAEEYDAVIEQVTRLKAEKSAAEGAAANLQRLFEVAQARSHADVSALQAQHAAAQERSRVSADALAVALRDGEVWRERCLNAERERTATWRDLDESRRGAAVLETRLKEYKVKDETAFQNVKRAKEEAESAVSERNRAQAKLARVEEELAASSARLEAQRAEMLKRREGDLAKQSTLAARALSAAQADARAAHDECAQLRALLERTTRDNRSAAVEMEQLKARAVHLVPGRIEDASKQAAQLASATARAEEAEVALEESLEKVARLSSAAQRSMDEWERERSALLAQAADLGRQLQRVESELEEKLGALQHLEANFEEVGRANRALSRGQAKVERRAGDEVQAMRLEKETQVRSLKMKLDEAVALYERSARDAEIVIASKDQLVNRWREEAQRIARSFEAASAEQREEIGRLMARVGDVSSRAQAGQTIIDGQEDDIGKLRHALQALKPSHEGLESRVADLSARLAVAAGREEELLRARSELRCQVDQLAVQRDRAERAHDAAARRCEELTWQLKETQSAIENVALSPLPVNLPHKSDDALWKDVKRKNRRQSGEWRQSR